MSDYKIESRPFSWEDKMAQLAIEDFDSIRDSFPYCQKQSIGFALAKLKMIEDGELSVQYENENLKEYIETNIQKQLEFLKKEKNKNSIQHIRKTKEELLNNQDVEIKQPKVSEYPANSFCSEKCGCNKDIHKCNRCFFYSEVNDMGLIIPVCNYHGYFGSFRFKCDKYIDGKDAYKIIKDVVNERKNSNRDRPVIH